MLALDVEAGGGDVAVGVDVAAEGGKRAAQLGDGGCVVGVAAVGYVDEAALVSAVSEGRRVSFRGNRTHANSDRPDRSDFCSAN
ncbi:hypothetical protein D3C71_1407540 [compost metagenome]